MFGLNEATDQLTTGKSLHLYAYVLTRGGGHVLRRALQLEVAGERK